VPCKDLCVSDSKDPDFELVRAVADDLPVGVWVAKVPGGEFLYSNRTFGEIMGQGPREETRIGAYTQPYGIYGTDGKLYPEDRLPIVQALRAREVVTVDDIVIHRHDGKRIPVRAHARPVMDVGGNVTHVVIVFFDISKEAEAQRASDDLEARLRHGQRMQSIGQLAGGIAHDFNNVLAVVRMLGARLSTEVKSSAGVEMLEQIDIAVQSGTRLAQQLLLMGGRGRTSDAPVVISALTESVAGLLSRTLDRRIVVTHEGDGTTLAVQGDASRLEQVVMNLAINARDALAGTGGKVIIRVRSQPLTAAAAAQLPPLKAGLHVVLEVEDNGPGIAPEHRGRIFEPYFTTRTNGDQRGSGLGLATVYGIVEAHQGTIEVADAVPHGALMRVWLPATEARPAPPSSAPRPPEALVHGSGLVLVVDDEAALRRVVASSLGAIGYEVLVAADGIEALDLIAQRPGAIGLMLLDLVMPRMDGHATFLAARELDPSLPVILATGTPDDPAARELAGMGVAQVLAKPYSLPELSRAIAKALRKT
jgi:two-component system cell cycle sensor histidine kinase/response regulator CckA